MRAPNTSIQLAPEAALVLFEFLDRHRRHGEVEIEHRAEDRALWLLRCQLESQLLEPFQPGYKAFLKEARQKLLAEPGYNDVS